MDVRLKFRVFVSLLLFLINSLTAQHEKTFEWTDSIFVVGRIHQFDVKNEGYCRHFTACDSGTTEMYIELAKFLKQNPKVVIQIECHIDFRGSDAYNLQLSERRAIALKNLLEKEYGIVAHQLIPVGYGESRPLIAESYIKQMQSQELKESSHRINRRTIVRIIQK